MVSTGDGVRTGAPPMHKQRVLVTGSTSGIGAAIAEAFAGQGAYVLVHGLDSSAGEALAGRLGGSFVEGDLADPVAVERLGAEVSASGPLRVLVNNAGVERQSTIADLDLDVLAWTMQVNFTAPTRLTQLLLPSLRAARDACVINVTSIHEEVPVYGNLAYCASKAALGMMTRTAALELGREGIRVNAIAPGAVATQHNAALLERIGPSLFEEWVPLRRVGTPADIAGIALFLASAAARYINGHTVVADGGYRHHLVRYPGGESSGALP